MKINFFIAGFQKSATTKVKEILEKNPHILMHKIEEMTFFIDEDYDERNQNPLFSEYYDNATTESLIGAKNVSMAINENSLQRLSKHNPNCKLILILRDPVERAYSAFWYCRRMGWEYASTIDEALDSPMTRYRNTIARRSCNYIDQGYYAKHLKTVYKYFNPSQVKIFVYEEDLKDIDKLNEIICEYLGVPTVEMDVTEVQKRVNVAAKPRYLFIVNLIQNRNMVSRFLKKYLPKELIKFIKSLKGTIIKINEIESEVTMMSDSTRDRLSSIYLPKNIELEKMLNRDFDCWGKNPPNK